MFGSTTFPFVDLSHLPTRCKFIALMPQWDFLNFLADHGKRFANFHLRMRNEVTELIEEGGRVAGVRAQSPEGPVEIRADLVVGCDGRHSVVRRRAGMQVEDLGAPMDVLWFRVSHRDGDPEHTMGRFEAGRILVMINRGDYWQCAYVIPKGGIDEVHRAGLDAFRANLAAGVPAFANRVGEIADWDQVKLLTVAVDRLTTWYKEGLLCIGDAAHAMSPIGGVGINLAVQDAVAAANLLWAPLSRGRPSVDDLARVQVRRMFPTRVTQWIQVVAQNNVVNRALQAKQELEAPLLVRWFARFPYLRRLPARLLGLGVRPEHVHTPARV